ncbi:ketopantoate reductase family protein, partial [Candidatus Thorarchaeota archaeon]
MKIVVVGSGAIGSLYGGFLSLLEGNEVALIGRSPHITAVQKEGLKIRGVMGKHHLRIAASEDANSISEADLVIITTKTYDTSQAALSAKHLVDGGAYVLIIQNGLGTEEQVAKVLGTRRVLRATTCMGALQEEPGIVEATGCGLTEVGSHYDENMDFVETVANMLD